MTLVLAQGLASCIFLFYPLCFSDVKKSIIFVLQGPPRGRSWGGALPPSFENYKELLLKSVFSPPPTPPPTPTLSQYSAPTLSTNLRGPQVSSHFYHLNLFPKGGLRQRSLVSDKVMRVEICFKVGISAPENTLLLCHVCSLPSYLSRCHSSNTDFLLLNTEQFEGWGFSISTFDSFDLTDLSFWTG